MENSQAAARVVGSTALLGATVAYVVLIGVGLATLGTLPAASETPSEVVAWFAAHRSGVRWAVWAFTVATLPLAVMTALLRRLLPEPHRDVFFIGAVALMVSTVPFTWILAGLSLHASSLEPMTARSVLDVAVFFGPVLTGTTTTMIAPVTLLALRGEAGLPKWLGILGAVAFVEQAIETVTIFGETGFTQAGGAMNFQLGAGLTLSWMIAFGIWGGVRGRPSIP